VRGSGQTALGLFLVSAVLALPSGAAGQQVDPQSPQPAATPAPKISPGERQFKLAMGAVDLDYKITLINAFLPHVTNAIHLGNEEITHENAKDVLARLQRERQTLTDEIDREGFSNIGGDYDLRQAAQGGCKDVSADAFGPVSVVQNQHAVEFKGKAPGCGVIVGTVVVLKPGECAAVSPLRLVGIVKDQGIAMMFLDSSAGIHCPLGGLTKRSAER
jgi:hypothetical protein